MCVCLFSGVHSFLIAVSDFNLSLCKLSENWCTPCPSKTSLCSSVLLEGGLSGACWGKKTGRGVLRVVIWESGRYLIKKKV